MSFAFSASSGTGVVIITLPVQPLDIECQFYGSTSGSYSLLGVLAGTTPKYLNVSKYDGTSIAAITGAYFKINGNYNI